MGRLQHGQLTYQEFEQGLQLFTEWWHLAVDLVNGGPCWKVKQVTLPVVEQVVSYAELERVLPPVALAAVTGSSVMQQTPVTASATPSDVALSAAAPASAVAATTSQQSAAVAPAPAVSTAVTEAAHMEEGIYELLDSDDACVTCIDHLDTVFKLPAANQQQQVHIHQYCIVWHETYQVPVLYIRAMRPDGVCLGLGELMQDLPGLQTSKEPSQADWTYITAVEHPLLRSPYFMLHPCQTADRMKLMMQQPYPVAASTYGADTAAVACSSRDSSGRKRFEVAPAAAAALPTAVTGTASPGGAEILHYMQCWFSLVAGAIGFSLVSATFTK